MNLFRSLPILVTLTFLWLSAKPTAWLSAAPKMANPAPPVVITERPILGVIAPVPVEDRLAPKPQSKKKPSLDQRRQSARKAVAYRKLIASGVPCHVVQVDLKSPHIRLRAVRAQDLGANSRSFRSFVLQTQPIAAITGTFFDTASEAIICNLVRDGKLLESGGAGHTLSLSRTNRAEWMSTAGVAGGRHDWSQSEFAVSGGPTLIRDGFIQLDAHSEGFSDPGLFRSAPRAGIATTPQGKLLLITVNQNITLTRFAQVMRSLGAQDAMNLDGGSSTALYAGGRYLAHPKRKLTNVIMVTLRP